MGSRETRDDRRVAEGERIAEAIETALRMRAIAPAGGGSPENRDAYRSAMIGLVDLLEGLAQERIDRHEQDAAYDAGRG